MDDLNGRVAVVTGGGSGIGRGIALTLGAEGMTVAVADLQESNARAVACMPESHTSAAPACSSALTREISAPVAVVP